jgi:hypothetical protein
MMIRVIGVLKVTRGKMMTRVIGALKVTREKMMTRVIGPISGRLRSREKK